MQNCQGRLNRVSVSLGYIYIYVYFKISRQFVEHFVEYFAYRENWHSRWRNSRSPSTVFVLMFLIFLVAGTLELSSSWSSLKEKKLFQGNGLATRIVPKNINTRALLRRFASRFFSFFEQGDEE